MDYTILRTEKADTQIRDIIYYIANDSGSAEIALGVLDDLESKISILSEQPYSAPKSRHPELRKQNFRIQIAGRYLIFYKVEEPDKTMIVYAVIDSRQDYVDIVL